ncbi:MAG: hypothetical protein H6Q25_1563 [Bacteroidetes bacterium]|nr:hypothetical protein [Bacteroidota bacterium]
MKNENIIIKIEKNLYHLYSYNYFFITFANK